MLESNLRGIKSYARRQNRMTPGQSKAIAKGWNSYVLDVAHNPSMTWQGIFGRQAHQRVVEIGFGQGEHLHHGASTHPDYDFIGIEVYRPGVGACLNRLLNDDLKNVRIISEDAVLVFDSYLEKCSVDIVLIYYPDPWHKTRHKKRRLIQNSFLEKIKPVLSKDALIHIVTDWADYATHVANVFTQDTDFQLVVDDERIPKRTKTKYAQRGDRLGHDVFEFVYQYCP